MFLNRSLTYAAAMYLLLLCAAGYSQLITTATINGTVSDSSGAVVPAAAVSLTNQETRTVTTTRSNSDGSFVAPGLPVGTYTVTVSKPGFQTFTETNIVLHPAIVNTINATLAAGQVKTEVQVQASAAQVETTTPELSSQVSQHQVETLPLNGRNYQSLSALMPGVTNTSPGNSLNQGGFTTSNVMSINGMGISGTMYYLDGIWNMNTGNMTQTTITPNPDTIQEVRVLQSNYGSQYSLNGANVVLLQTRSGTANFHGAAFEYFRNDKLNTRNFFSPAVSPLKQNIFGYTLGGPVYIPGHYNSGRNKTFFFWSEQWVRQDAGQVLTGATPTADMRNGIFSGTLKDPDSGLPFPQNGGITQIPVSRLNSSALALAKAVMPLPNNPAGGFNNYINPRPQINNERDDEIKIDHIFDPKFRLTGEYLDSRSQNQYPNESTLGSPFDTIRDLRNSPNSLAELQLTQVWSPAMVNTTGIAMNRYITRFTAAGISQQSQVPGLVETLPYTSGSAASLLPQIGFSQGWSTVGLAQNVPQPGADDLEDTFSDDWSLLRGNHYIQAGMQLLFGTKRQTSFAQNNGNWQFTGVATGNAMADFFLGDAATFSQASNRPRYYVHYIIASPYIQDRWRVNRRLTVTAGLRLQYMPSAHAQPTFESAFDPSRFNPANVPGVSANGTLIPTANFDPLNGLVINGANGVPLNFSNAHQYYWAPSFGFAWDMFGDGKTSLRGGYGITYYSNLPSNCAVSCTTNPPFVQSITLVRPTFANPLGAQVSPSGAPTLVSEDLTNLRDPMIQSYSLSLEHQFAGNWFASLAGAGNVARHMPATWNINQPLPDAPYSYNPVINTGSTFAYLFSPYRGYAAINTATYNFNAYWNALELHLRHPLSHNLFLSAAYTWQHGLSQGHGNSIFGLSAIQDVYHPGNEYGNSDLNVPQVFTVSVIWSLPWFQTASGWKRAVLGGWQYSNITAIQSGFSLEPGIATSTKGLATRSDRTSQPIDGPHTVTEWFNTAAFAAPAAGYFGNAAPGSIRGPGTVNFDMAFYKTFHITEHHALEFRAELFNIFNHTNFSSVQTSFGANNFGQITAARDPRIAEGVLRYTF
ncbi:MAG TPA: carboxypeptidase regulatory-like domain-containing protein [Bryobacteraceae bacterium]|nr:carboxypeptidase regulatory-like domain-containing protein [Bryobacteraceae bacterium]